MHRHKKGHVLTPPEWRTHGRPRVLLENPDLADAGAQAAVLRDAGYDVEFCAGPQLALRTRGLLERPNYWSDDPELRSERLTCPLTCDADCALVRGADVVVTTSTLVDGASVRAGVDDTGTPMLVVEPNEQVTPEAIQEALARAPRAE